MQCDRCKRTIKADGTTYAVQYRGSFCPEEICEFCLDKDGEEISEFIELDLKSKLAKFCVLT